jgi:hypothetical protein
MDLLTEVLQLVPVAFKTLIVALLRRYPYLFITMLMEPEGDDRDLIDFMHVTD